MTSSRAPPSRIFYRKYFAQTASLGSPASPIQRPKKQHHKKPYYSQQNEPLPVNLSSRLWLAGSLVGQPQQEQSTHTA